MASGGRATGRLLRTVVALAALVVVGACGAPAATSTTVTEPGAGAGVSSAAAPSATTPAPSKSLASPPASAAARTPTAAPAAGQTVTVRKVIDGDTIDTSVGRIRIVGIDTPEKGDCGYKGATEALRASIAAAGDQVVLVPSGQGKDTDRYGRLLRYVDTSSGTDLGLGQISSGWARARYDSRDGYGAHPRERTYIAADANSPALQCPQP